MAQTYDPYGTVYVSAGSGASSFGYTGEQVDANGLVYLRARYYQPSMGLFVNMDPSRQEMNPYRYAFNSPTNYVDPEGTFPCTSPSCESSIPIGGASSLIPPTRVINIVLNIVSAFGNCGTAGQLARMYSDYMEGYWDQFILDMTANGWIVNTTVNAVVPLLIDNQDVASYVQRAIRIDPLYYERKFQAGSTAYRIGRYAGRLTSWAIAGAELVVGLPAALSNLGITLVVGAGAGGCAAVTAGSCVGLGGLAVAVEGSVSVGALLVAAHGGAVIYSNFVNEISGSGGGGSSHSVPDELTISDDQLGPKMRSHLEDYGRDVTNEADRNWYIEKIHDVFDNPDQIRFGPSPTPPGNNEYYFIKGNDLLRVTESGEFISLYRGANSPWLQNMTVVVP